MSDTGHAPVGSRRRVRIVIRDVDDAHALLVRSKVMTLTATGAVPALVTAVAGEVAGSWWSHPDGQHVYRIAEALSHRDDVLVVKLVAGKVTFVHRELWPALLRAVTDAPWRSRAHAALSLDAQRLLARVEDDDELRLADALPADATAAQKKQLAKSKDTLERSLLVYSQQEHSGRGHHETVLRSWSAWAEAARVKPSNETAEAARRAVVDVCHGQPTALSN
jgi:hypothetical protein